jgi:hypothetical protein
MVADDIDSFSGALMEAKVELRFELLKFGVKVGIVEVREE